MTQTDVNTSTLVMSSLVSTSCSQYSQSTVQSVSGAAMAAKEEAEDQILAQLGHIGSWQWRGILVTGLFSTPTVCHTMVITFMNAEVRALYSRRR